jgi:hypothetical protein
MSWFDVYFGVMCFVALGVLVWAWLYEDKRKGGSKGVPG